MELFHETTREINALRERIQELARIRQGFAAHLGSSLYEVTKDDESLRWGRESLYDGIAACDSERARILSLIAQMESGAQEEGEQTVEEEVVEIASEEVPASVESEEGVSEEETHAEDMTQEVAIVAEQDVAEVVAEQDEREDPDKAVQAQQDEGRSELDEGTKSVVLEPDEQSEGYVGPDLDQAVVSQMTDEPVEADRVVAAEEPEAVAQPAADEFADDTGVTCPVCGAPVNVGDLFCMTCGSSIEAQPAADSVPAPAADETTRIELEATGYVQPVTQAPQQTASLGSQCPTCGALAAPGNKFCMECGTPLGAMPQQSPSAPVQGVCPNCGNPVDSSFKFCMSCGHKLV